MTVGRECDLIRVVMDMERTGDTMNDYTVYARPPDRKERPIGAFDTIDEAERGALAAKRMYMGGTRTTIFHNGRIVRDSTSGQ